ncbi:MAG: type II CRISPR RNA-guided endonuclease Cas9, partial [Eubacterium sp.]|nr:type II CRISPR RNA-guided endonuclease Cas9 [Eubacterium sp.]
YREELEKYQQDSYKVLSELQAEDLDDLYFSAPVKRMVWQTILIIKEVEKIMGTAPKRLFVEMTRKEEKQKKRKDSRKQQFMDLYKNIKDEEHDWKSIIENADENGTIRSKKMFLYLTQMGRSMYTGKPIDLDQLFNDNLYDIDHIYPRHFVKDDNLADNLVLVEKELNAHKSDTYPLEQNIYMTQQNMWRELNRKKLISDEKLKRLTGRNPFTDEQKAGFIARQLVETSQGTKGVTTILQQALPDTTIVYAKASNVSEFRQKRNLVKTRVVNDFHHAQDAYLNIVVGNVYFVKFTQNPLQFIQKDYAKDSGKNHYNLSRMFDWDVKRGGETAWVAQNGKEETGTIVTVRRMMTKNTPLLTRMNFEGHGGLADQTLYSAKKAAGVGYIPLKGTDARMQDVTKYGGFSSVSTAYYILVEHTVKDKRVRTLETVPVLWKERIEKNPQLLQVYCEKELGLAEPSIRMKKIKIQSLVNKGGYNIHISGKTGNQISVRNAISVCLDQKWMNYVKELEKGEKSEKVTIEDNLELYNILCDKHNNGIFKKKPNPVGIKLQEDREKFEQLSCVQQGSVLLEILNLTKIGVTSANLSLIGEAAKTGVMLISKKVSEAEEFILINQSVTGVYENRIDLLTV